MIAVPVLIVGGGAAGCAVARALSREGVPSLLAEAAQGIAEDLRDPNVTLLTGWRLFGFERFEDGVTAHLLEVDGDRQQQVRAGFLVGCDGADSRVRHFLDLDVASDGKGCVGRGRVRLAGDAAGVSSLSGVDGLAAMIAGADRHRPVG